MTWKSFESMPDQTGRLAVVTGANSGIGYETARALAHKGARVVLACRNEKKAQQAVGKIEAESPAGSLETVRLDLGSLKSVDEAADKLLAHKKIDLLIANAGVMMPKTREETEDGFEMQIGTNHFSHFALVGKLLGSLQAAEGSRVVSVSSMAHKSGKLDLEDIDWKRRRYMRFPSYGASKLANLLFAYELQRKLKAAGSSVLSTAAHPGWTATNLQRTTPSFRLFNPFVSMKPPQGALPTLYAATAPDAAPGGYYGPSGIYEVRGWPKKVDSSRASRNERLAADLWSMSEERTGVKYPF